MQACDICRKRKVKCDRHAPCSRCRRLRQQCTYTDILRKKGPKFVHRYPRICTPSVAYISTIATETQPPVYIGTELAMNGFQSGVMHTAMGTETETGTGAGDGSEELGLDLGLRSITSVHHVRGPAQEDVLGDLALYVKTQYPLLPVVDIRELRLHPHSGRNPPKDAFLYSLRAAVRAHSSLSLASSPSTSEHERACDRLLRGALLARAHCDVSQVQSRSAHDAEDNRYKLLSSFFLFMTYWNLQREKNAWWYLRECVALLLSSRMHCEDEYRSLEPRETEYKRRVFWGVFIAERTFCLLYDKPITLRPWIEPPTLAGFFDQKGILPGFVRLVTLFRGVDVDLSGSWTAVGFVTPIALTLVTSPAADNDDDIEGGVSIQALNFAITREWLRAKIWKLGIPRRRSSEFVASRANSIWRLDEPLFAGRAILEVLRSSQGVLEEAWCGILDQKLYDVCECLCDILPAMQARGQSEETEFDQVLRGLLEVLSVFPGRSASLLSHAYAR
ncbi:Zn(II)2Cys6 transcription factor [Aspergillus lucknowensis]|uniref:Zn(2)-C6 fungal-type domain-containing protein n=1 Tax=Aspergillus lucknowensis TaxID=176173 RepID=A0ABR4LJ20_9EURO